MQMRWRWPPENFVRIAGFVVGLQAAVIHDLVNIIIELCLGHQVMLAHSLTR